MTGILAILAIFGLAYALSNNRKAIQWRIIITGFALQWVIAIFVLKVSLGQQLFAGLSALITQLLEFSNFGAAFVFGPLVSQPETMRHLFGPGGDFIFAFKLVPTIVFVATLVSIAYHIGLMQRVVQSVAWVVAKLMGASGAEALSNAASIFVGQIEAQLMIKPYVPSMTASELLASMSGSLACISGGIMAVFIGMGVPAAYLLTASLMAAPGALVIAKMVYPETEVSETMGQVRLAVKPHTVNLIDAAAQGASDGFKIALQVVAMLLGFIALIHLVDWVVGAVGQGLSQLGVSLQWVGLDLSALSLKDLLGSVFSGAAILMGVPIAEARTVGGMMGTKLVVNEFVAFMDLLPYLKPESSGLSSEVLSQKSVAIATFALCGFANFSSVAMQIGGIGEMAPNRKADLARLGLTALLCGTMASYMSASIAGILISL